MPQRRIRLAIATLLAICAFGAVGSWILIDALDDARGASVERATDTYLDAQALQLALTDRSSTQRGYLLSGDPGLLREHAAARRRITERIAALRRRTSLVADLADLEATLRRLDYASDVALTARATDRQVSIGAWERDVWPLAATARKQIHTLSVIAWNELGAARDAADEAAHRGRVMLVWLAIACLAAFALILTMLVRSHREMIDGALRDQERALLEILEEVPVGVYVTRGDGSHYYANRTARALLGGPLIAYEADTDRRYPPERNPLARALAGESSEVSDLELRRDDVVVPLHVRGAPVRDPAGNVAFAVAAFQDVRELHRHAMRDSLTGLVNRTVLRQTFGRDKLVLDRKARRLCVGVIDLDHFKAINDQHGHAMGDQVLREVAAVVAGCLRRSDVVGRWGGEEFVVLLPDSDLDGAARALEKALAAVRRLPFPGFSVTFSAGIAIARKGDSLDAVVARADAALYEAKHAGRARVRCAPATALIAAVG